MKLLIAKFKESLMSVLPIVVIVLAISFTPIFTITVFERQVYLLSAVMLIIGMTLFNLGAEFSMTPMGDYAGTGLIKTKKISLILLVALFMGFLVTVAEPDLTVLAEQVREVIDSTVLIYSVGIGVGVFLLIALLKTIFNVKLSMLLLLFYMMIFAVVALLCENGKSDMLSLAFDSGGVTTGPITVPFIMSFGVGIAATIAGKNSGENSFGFVALCSIGPIIVVLMLFLLAQNDLTYTLTDYSMNSILSKGILHAILEHFWGVAKALFYIFIFFMILNYLVMKLPFKKMLQIIIGMIITLIGLVMFLTSASIGFLPIGYSLGSQLIMEDPKIAISLCFVIGMTVVLAEPAIHVLTVQVEEVTGGTVTKKSMLIALSIGVGIAIALSIIRIINRFSLLYYLVPGYFISLALSLFVPPIYTAIAFDSGGVASGPLTSTFILPLMIGACANKVGESGIMNLAFGVVALVAMIPLISIQLLGFRAIFAKILRDRISMNRILRADDDQIIYFEE